MYRHCIFCTAGFDTNEEIESFTTGAQLAFDVDRGRLWAICQRCQRWNLAPIEERWEAVEQAERSFRAAALRAQHENIGVARLDSGMLLVRVGDALPTELATWRYGDHFRRRLRRHRVASAANLLSTLALGFWVPSSFVHGRRSVVAAQGRAWRLSHLAGAEFIHEPEGIRLALPPREGWFRSAPSLQLDAGEANAVLGRVLPAVNHRGADARLLDAALGRLDAAGSGEEFLQRLGSDAGRSSQLWPLKLREWQGSWCLCGSDGNDRETFPGRIDAPTALAMEMALHSEMERHALAGRLAELTRAWREAEEIASIADSL